MGRDWERPAEAASGGPLGVDLNAGRARAAGRDKPFPLDGTHTDLPLAVVVGPRGPAVGRDALAVSRKHPHAVCINYLPHLPALGQSATPAASSARTALPPEQALAAALGQIRSACAGHDRIALALPAYLSPPQVAQLLAVTGTVGLPVWGTAATPVALAAERAAQVLQGSAGGSFPPTSVLIVDADDHAITIAVVRLTVEEVRVISTRSFPRLGVRLWRDRLLDALAERCVRQCRRDPRAAADVEQMVFDQIDPALDLVCAGQRVSFCVRAASWYQDVAFAAADVERIHAALAGQAGAAAGSVMDAMNEVEPPEAAWLTHDAGRLPGLSAAIHQSMPEGTSVRVLPAEAAAQAAAHLLDRWGAGHLPRIHLATAVPLNPGAASRPAAAKVH